MAQEVMTVDVTWADARRLKDVALKAVFALNGFYADGEARGVNHDPSWVEEAHAWAFEVGVKCAKAWDAERVLRERDRREAASRAAIARANARRATLSDGRGGRRW